MTSIQPRRARPGMEPLFCFSSLSIRIRALSDLPACHMYNAPWYNATSPQLSASILTCISFDEQMLDEYCIGVCVCVCVCEREGAQDTIVWVATSRRQSPSVPQSRPETHTTIQISSTLHHKHIYPARLHSCSPHCREALPWLPTPALPLCLPRLPSCGR